MPFAADPTDLGEVVEPAEFGEQEVLGSFAVEFQEVDLLYAVLGQ